MMLDCNEMIEERLWVGSFIRPEEVSLLKLMRITTILNLQSDADLIACDVSIKKIIKACALAGIELRRIPIPDFDRSALSAQLPEAVEGLVEALASRETRVYLHCTAGINRGPTLAAAYLIKNRGLSAEEAYDYVIARRHCSPYLGTLKEYEVFLKNDHADRRHQH
jgi:protein-tyrosine phosphatase